jgi:hypothetical protein
MASPNFAFRCNVCSKQFSGQRGLGVHHAKSGHGEFIEEDSDEVFCECGAVFGSDSALNQHIAAGECVLLGSAAASVSQDNQGDVMPNLPWKTMAFISHCIAGNAPLRPLNEDDRANLKLGLLAAKYGMSHEFYSDVVRVFRDISGGKVC